MHMIVEDLSPSALVKEHLFDVDMFASAAFCEGRHTTYVECFRMSFSQTWSGNEADPRMWVLRKFSSFLE